MDMRLKTAKYTVSGKEYELCCNMNVLADVQETVDGDMLKLFNSGTTYKTVLVFGAAMLNEYADAQGWPERFTAKSLGRQIEGSPVEFFFACYRPDYVRDLPTGRTAGRKAQRKQGTTRQKLTNHAEPVQRGIDFAWYLNIWINVWHNDERVFWRTMTPNRFIALYCKYFKVSGLDQKACAGTPQEKPSLFAYMMGGG